MLLTPTRVGQAAHQGCFR